VSFDLFETLIRVDRSALPTVTWPGGSMPSTVPLLLAALTARGHSVSPVSLLTELIRAEQAADRECVGDLRERPAALMFERAVRGLGCARGNGDAAALGEVLADEHMRAVAAASATEPGARSTLAELRARGFKLALVSNLDHARAKAWLLARTRLDGMFDAVVVSAEVGVRKPHGRIFTRALDALGLEPEAVLHVGDNPVTDVEGASAAGMRTAHLTRAGAPTPRLPADLVVGGLAELPALVERPAA
jgi:HAD superfamily hydrolase (TIGR01549 family)